MRRFDGLVIAAVTAILVAALAAISWQTVRTAERLLLPELDQTAETAARSLAGLVSEAVSYGIPLDELVRPEEVLSAVLAENEGFSAVAIRSADGAIVAAATAGEGGAALLASRAVRATAAPVVADGAEVGAVVVATPASVAETLVRELWLDVAVLLVVAVLVALELVAFAFSAGRATVLRGLARRLDALRRGDFRPHIAIEGKGVLAHEADAVDREIERLRRDHAMLRNRAVAVGDTALVAEVDRLGARHGLAAVRHEPPVNLVAVRAPVFLFFFAEELTRPFLPSYIESFATPVAGLSTELVIALPIILFMAIVAFSQPSLNGWTERFGRSRSLRAGALVALLGYLGTAAASSMAELLAFRALTAIGFATVFVAAQGYIVDRTGAQNRARGIGLFVSAIMAAMLCGPPIGGIVADRLGPSAAFVVSAGMALAAYATALFALRSDVGKGKAAARGVRLSDIVMVLRQPVLVLLLVGCALPAKVILIGICFYYLPLSLAQEFEPAVIGRVLMLYGLAMLLIIPAISRFSDEKSRRGPYVVAGGLLSGLAVVHLFIWPEPWGAALLVLQIGIAQGISTTPQSALVGELGKRHLPHLSEGGLYGVFRLIERTGTAVGPAFVAIVWGAAGGSVAVVAVGLLVAAGAILFGLATAGGAGSPTAAAAPRQG